MFKVLNDTEDSLSVAVNSERIVEAVKNKHVFLGAVAFIVSSEHKRLINFTTPIGIEPYTFLVARPQELSRALLFLSPFGGDVGTQLNSSLTYERSVKKIQLKARSFLF